MLEVVAIATFLASALTLIRYFRAGAVLDRKRVEKADLEARALREEYIERLEARVNKVESELEETRGTLIRCQHQVTDLGNSLASLAATVLASAK